MSTRPAPDAVPQKTPVKVELLAGYRYAWCACGLSKMQPWCDGSHTSSKAEIRPVIWVQEKDQTALLCGCKHTDKAPFCSNAHRKL